MLLKMSAGGSLLFPTSFQAFLVPICSGLDMATASYFNLYLFLGYSPLLGHKKAHCGYKLEPIHTDSDIYLTIADKYKLFSTALSRIVSKQIVK